MKFLRDKDAAAKCAMSRGSLWRKAKTEPGFPQPVKVSAGITAWIEHELDAWLAARVAAAREPATTRVIDPAGGAGGV